MNRRIIVGVLAGLMVPYLTTLAWTGTIHGEELRHEQQAGAVGKRRILLDRGGTGYYMDVEEYLPGVLARQMPADYEIEALRAQAVVARTYIYKQMGGSPGDGSVQEVPESALDLDCMETAQMKALWGSAQFPAIYEKLEDAVQSTAGVTMVCDGQYIDAMFCRATAGRTRAGDEGHPYLQPVDCPKDVEADGYLQMLTFTRDEFAGKISGIPDSSSGARPVEPGQIPDSVQIVSRDDGGYVTALQIGGHDFTGEEVQYALGLQSSCFTLEPYEDGMRAVVKGIGHGYGLSQAGANARAREGWKAEEILTYFYKNIELISE